MGFLLSEKKNTEMYYSTADKSCLDHQSEDKNMWEM